MAPNPQNSFLNRIRGQVVETGANTLTELEIPTGVRASEGRVMAIKRIISEFDVCIGPSTELQTSSIRGALATQQGLAALPDFAHISTIWRRVHQNQKAGDGATAAEAPGMSSREDGMGPVIEFDPPILVADDVISLYIEGTGQSAARGLTIVIHYEVRSVTLTEALQILESYR